MANDGWDGILQDGETILWQGQPDGSVDWRLCFNAAGAVGLAIALGGLLWMVMAFTISSGGPAFFRFFFPLFGLPFLALGLYMGFGAAVFDAYMRRHTWYTLTDRTAFVATNAAGEKRLHSFPIRDMPRLDLEDGLIGSVLFGAVDDRLAGFRRISSAREVYRMIREARGALNFADRQARD